MGFRRVPPSVRDAVIRDYIHSFLTVDQIAKKHNVSIRYIHSVTGDFHRNNEPQPNRLSLRLTKQEAETLLLCIAEADYVIDVDRKTIARILEDRLLEIADKLTQPGGNPHEEQM